jgi:transposase-like protein
VSGPRIAPRGSEESLGPEAPGLSATIITRLKAVWEGEHQAWAKRSLAGKHYVYVWADGVHFNIRLEEGRQCILVLMGATPDGKKELIALADGYQESEHQQCLNHLLRRADGMAATATRGAVRFPRRVAQLHRAGLDLRDRHEAGEISLHGLTVARGRLPGASQAWTLARSSPASRPNARPSR